MLRDGQDEMKWHKIKIPVCWTIGVLVARREWCSQIVGSTALKGGKSPLLLWPSCLPPLPPPSPRASSATPPLFLSLCPITSPRILSPYLLAPLPPPPHLPPPSVDPVSFILSDGQQVQQLLEDPPTLHRLIDEAFSVLDTDGSGALSASELRPAVETMKEHVQLPPWGGRRIAALSWPSSPLSPARTSLFQAP